MIKFFINDIEIVLPENISIQLIEENPLITRNGQFTLDITTSLLQPANAKAFKHIQRINNTTIIESLDCILMIDSQQIFGKCVILNHSKVDVTWQFVAGNSYLNYFAKDERKIWELDFGTEEEVTFAIAYNSTLNPGVGNFICAPVKAGDVVLNDYYFNDSFESSITCIGAHNIAIQPYLMYYIRKLPELLGYVLTDNVLDTDNRAKRMFIVNTAQSLNYSDFLPDMTIFEFLDSIEKFFNITFLLDSKSKTFSIVRTNEYIKTLPKLQLTNVIDDYLVEEDEKELNLSFFCSELEYDHLNETQFMKYNKLSDDILSKLKVKQFANLSAIVSSLSGTGGASFSKTELYIDNATGNHYMFEDATKFEFPTVELGYFQSIRLIDKFRNLKINDFKLGSVKLGISPVSIHLHEVVFKYRGSVGGTPVNTTLNAKVQISESSNSKFIDSAERFRVLVEEGVKNLPRLNFIECGFTRGNVQIPGGIASYKYPFVWVDNVSDSSYQQDITLDLPECTFRIYGSNGILDKYYSNLVLLEKGSLYKFKFKEKKKMPIKAIYLHENKSYVPIKFERTISSKKTLVTGYFYRMR